MTLILGMTFVGMLASFAFHVVGLCVLWAIMTFLALWLDKRTSEGMSGHVYRKRVLCLSVSCVAACLVARRLLWGGDFGTGYAVPEEVTGDLERLYHELNFIVVYWTRLIWTYALVSTPFVFVLLMDSVKRLRDMGQNVKRVWLLLVPIRNIFFFYDLLVDPTRDQRFEG